MNSNTFGSSEQYKMLEFLTEKINELDDNRKNYISSLIHDINSNIKKSKDILDEDFKHYVLKIIRNDIISHIDENLSGKYDKKIITYLKNYVYAKTNNYE